MIIEFSVALLETMKLTPNEFFVAILIKRKEFSLLASFLSLNFTKEESEKIFMKLIDLKYITSKSWLQNSYDYSECKIGNALYALLKPDEIFEEFLEAYPKSVIRSDGVVDYLRTDQRQCRMLYLAATKMQQAQHQHILKCLKFDVNKRTRDGSLKYMVRMSKWIGQQTWKSFEDEINSMPTTTEKYGTTVE